MSYREFNLLVSSLLPVILIDDTPNKGKGVFEGGDGGCADVVVELGNSDTHISQLSCTTLMPLYWLQKQFVNILLCIFYF